MAIAEDPVIFTFTPNPAIRASSSPSSSTVPLEYAGTVITCFGSGWPTPTIEWRRDGQSLSSDADIETELSPRDDNPFFVWARLRWNRAFRNLDAGEYECIVQGNENDIMSEPQSEIITLLAGDDPILTPTPSHLLCELT